MSFEFVYNDNVRFKSDIITENSMYGQRPTLVVGASSYDVQAVQSNQIFLLTASDFSEVTFNLPEGQNGKLGTNYTFTKIVSGVKIVLQPTSGNQIEDSALGATLYSGNSSVSLSAGQQEFASINIYLATPTIWHIDSGRKTWTTTQFV